MQVPKRRSEEHKKYPGGADDYLSPEAIAKLRADLRRLQEVSRPRAAEDLARARDMGDLSENAAYSEAKGRLNGILRRILEIQEKLKTAVVIERGSADGTVGVGATVVVRVLGKQKTYEITGSAETDPASGRVSHLSPLGAALKGHRAGDAVTVRAANGRDVVYEILEVR
jgi:transcription elongation factor GreA